MIDPGDIPGTSGVCQGRGQVYCGGRYTGTPGDGYTRGRYQG